VAASCLGLCLLFASLRCKKVAADVTPASPRAVKVDFRRLGKAEQSHELFASIDGRPARRDRGGMITRALESPAFRRRLLTTALACGARSQEDAEDCVQDGMLLALTTETTPDDGKIEAWLSIVVANATRMKRRSATRQRRGGTVMHVELLPEVVAADDDPEAHSFRREVLAITSRALAREADAELVLSCAIHPDFLTTAADAGGASRDTLKSRLQRARARLRAAVRRGLEAPRQLAMPRSPSMPFNSAVPR
jgi:DNA-directed RNA polymerase specialized sigma24 family protein